MTLPTLEELRIPTLGPASLASPLSAKGVTFVDERDRVLLASTTSQFPPAGISCDKVPTFEPAGPRSKIYFDPEKTTCGIVTCGGLCPGLNDVIRAVVLTLDHHYGVNRVLGFRYGYAGLSASSTANPLELSLSLVDRIHEHGGTILGTSRGPQDPDEMLDTLVRQKVSILFAVGGDGTLRGASLLAQTALKRKLPIAVIGIPKTIDNDVEWVVRSFGFTTAVDKAFEFLNSAHLEATGVWNGVGLVKLMGRDSGFIAAHATLANSDVNFCLVPEVPFCLEGDQGFLRVLENRLDKRHHALVAIAEGAGQHLLTDPRTAARDESGNLRYPDIGTYLRDRIRQYFKAKQKPVDVKYIDPSYSIRGVPANAFDSELCLALGQHAVHAGMSGRTNMMVGFWNQCFAHVPIALATQRRKHIDPRGTLWQRVMETTGQPHFDAAPPPTAHG